MKRIALLTFVVVLSGCGDSRSVASEPTLPAPLAARLAAYADETARLAASGDGCGAREQALALQRATVAAINAHRVPGPLQEPLQASANDLVDRLACTLPTVETTTVAPREDDNGEKQGKRKGKGQKKGEE